MYRWYCDFLECYVPFKPQHGNHYLKGRNGRYRRVLRKQALQRSKQINKILSQWEII